MNILAPGKWKINEQGELEPDDDKAKDYAKTSDEAEGQTFYCLFQRTD